MIEEVSAQVIAFVERDLAKMSNTARRRLSTCLPHLGDLIEGQCPVVLIPKARGGIDVAYGPEGIQPGQIILMTATPESGVMLCLNDWPVVPDARRQEFSTVEIADEIATAIDEANLTAVNNGIALLLGKDSRDRHTQEIADIYAQGFTPLIIVLIATGPPKLSMYTGTVVLPGSLRSQITRIEAAE